MINTDFWKGKRVLVTGHTGFHGSWLSIWLNEMGAEVIGYSLSPNDDNDNYVLSNLNERITDLRGDIKDKEKLSNVFATEKPEIVLHLASQNQNDTVADSTKVYENNILGTLNVLDCVRKTESVKVAVMVTSDKCYEDKSQIWGYREDDRLGGKDPYSASKACSELIISSYVNTYMNPDNYDVHGKSVASVRCGNVIGGGDWTKDRTIPECVKAFENDETLVLSNPAQIRSWLHVLEPTYGIILLAMKMYEEPLKYCESWNFGAEYSSCMTVLEAAKKFKEEFRKGEIIELDEIGDDFSASTMVLDITKARYKLGWKPKWSIDKTIKYTAEWYKSYKTSDVYDICKYQIERYMLY
ncbi:MAG: CDP-glucose 4,6-dehydratase [Lachnospiraceae bacterium]|nr:CDP-glucose 4,6-dehydratase [Lachnospiraceae bacterium]